MVRIRNKKSKLKYCAVLIVLVLLFVGLDSLTYRYIDNILLDANIDTMKEMAEHDKRVLVNWLDSQWDSLGNIPSTIEKMDLRNDKDIIKCLQVVNRPYTDSLTILVTGDGLCYQSDGLIAWKKTDFDFIEEKSGRFAVIYDLKDDSIVERRMEYLLIGLETEGLYACGREFRYAFRRINISAMDSQLRIDSFGGEGVSSVISADGSFIINMNRSGSIMERKNFFDSLEGAQLSGGRNISQIREELLTSPDGVTFAAVTDDVQYITHIVKLEPMDWYFVSQVPRSVFSSLSRRIFVVVTGLLMLIIAITLVFLLVEKRAAMNRSRENELHRRQLSEALELAQQSSRAKTTFLNNISHDIRTPLNAVTGFTELAQRHIDNKDEVKDYLCRISQSSEHLLSLINDILNMSRIESGKTELQESDEELGEMLHGVIDMIMPQVTAKSLRLFVDARDIRNEHVVCDRLRLTQVLLNLVSNAVKYTPAGGSISCCITQGSEKFCGVFWYEFSVKDTGIGMSEEFAATVFEPFTREETPEVSGTEGTGLGLAIAKNLVVLMGGDISCKSEKGSGTEFVVRLPIKVRETPGEEDTLSLPEGMSALVVDENADVCRSVCAMLSKLGIYSEWCVSGSEAVERTGEAVFCGEPFDLFIIGWHRGGTDGADTAQAVRAEAGRKARIVVMSVYERECFGEAAGSCDVSEYIRKPVFPSDIRNVLKRLYTADGAQQDEPQDMSILSGRRVLLAEDNETNRFIARAILCEEGVKVDTAENGREACDMLSGKPAGYYDLVLMDVHMPVMDGYEAARKIRAFSDRELAAVPIIAMTANAGEENRQCALDAGMDSYITKPFDVGTLIREIAEHLPEREKK
ncbi:MAG: response regulator [Oscillospiraceae bacterium]|nr:response regulator [Oscillospiraceae bacterium]